METGLKKAAVQSRRSLEAFLGEQAHHCTLCPRGCGVDRGAGEKGYCGVGLESRYISEFVHFGEEKRLIPSYVIFFSGCNLRCGFCYNYSYVVTPGRHVGSTSGTSAERLGGRRAAGRRHSA